MSPLAARFSTKPCIRVPVCDLCNLTYRTDINKIFFELFTVIVHIRYVLVRKIHLRLRWPLKTFMSVSFLWFGFVAFLLSFFSSCAFFFCSFSDSLYVFFSSLSCFLFSLAASSSCFCCTLSLINLSASSPDSTYGKMCRICFTCFLCLGDGTQNCRRADDNDVGSAPLTLSDSLSMLLVLETTAANTGSGAVLFVKACCTSLASDDKEVVSSAPVVVAAPASIRNYGDGTSLVFSGSCGSIPAT